MAKFGWFFLIYFVTGWVIDIFITLSLFVIAACKDSKHNDKTQCLKSYSDAIDDANALCAENDNGHEGFGKFKAWLIGRLIWPVALPIGLNYYWNAIKEADTNHEGD